MSWLARWNKLARSFALGARLVYSTGRAPPRRFDPGQPELIDRHNTSAASVQEELRMLENANRRLGGHALVLQHLRAFLPQRASGVWQILDLGTGAADIPRAIAAWTRQRRRAVAITAVDGNSGVVRLAREACAGWPEIQLEQRDLRDLPYAPESFDVVLCSLALHHFSAAEAIALLQRMRVIARSGCLVNDLRRNWLAIGITDLLARTVIRSPIFRQDAAQSCRAAFTVGELRKMAGQAGYRNFQISRHHGMFRMVLIERK